MLPHFLCGHVSVSGDGGTAEVLVGVVKGGGQLPGQPE